MSFNLERIFAGKRAYRQKLTALPVAEKLRMLDTLRERALTLRRATRLPGPEGRVLREEPPSHPARPAP